MTLGLQNYLPFTNPWKSIRHFFPPGDSGVDQRYFYGPANIVYNYHKVGLIFLRPPHLGIEIAIIRGKKGGSKLDPIL